MSATLKHIRLCIRFNGEISFVVVSLAPLEMLSYRQLDGLVIPGEVAESLVLEELTRWFRFGTSCCVSEPKFRIITACLSITLLACFFWIIIFSVCPEEMIIILTIMILLSGTTQGKRCLALQPIEREAATRAPSSMSHVGSS